MATNSSYEHRAATVKVWYYFEAMATSKEESLSESIPLLKPDSRIKKSCRNRCKNVKFRGIGSKYLLLILMWCFVIRCSLSFSVKEMNLMANNNGEVGFGFYNLGVTYDKYTAAFLAIGVISIPITSILAEVVFSRYKLVTYTLRGLWLLFVFDCILSIFSGYFSAPETAVIIRIVLVLIPAHILHGSLLASAIPLGNDQIPGGSASNISAFIHWIVWVYFGGIALPDIVGVAIQQCTLWLPTTVNMVFSLISITLLTFGVILDFSFGYKLIREPTTHNPVTHIVRVLKYAARHKHPVRRSAFTYCEDEKPSRLDYGKSKYGGPFTTEQVEDVKTFWRATLVILAVCTLFVPLTSHVLVSDSVMSNFLSTKKADCGQSTLSEFAGQNSFTLYSVPLYELVVLPFLRHRAPGILQSTGVGAAAIITSSLYGLIEECIRYLYTNDSSQCVLTSNVPDFSCYVAYIPFNFIVSFAVIMLSKSCLVFICAQAPYHMKGLLIGICFTIAVMSIFLGVLFYEAAKRLMVGKRHGIWFYLTTLALVGLSSLLVGLVVRWYKGRERDEISRSQNMVEEIYYKYQCQEERHT